MVVPFPIAVFIALFVLCAFPLSTSAIVRTWDNGNGNGNWSTAANWSGDTVPDADDIAYFGTTSTANSSVDASFVGRVNAVMVAPGYTGTITLGRTLSVGTGGIIFSGGTLDVSASNYQLSVSGSFVNLGGTLVERQGTLLLGGTRADYTLREPGALNNLTLNNGLVGYWKFDDATGVTATDSSGNRNNGTLTNMETGADWVTTGLPSRMRSFNQSALDFDGSNEYVVSSSVLPISGVQPRSVAFWFKPSDKQGRQDLFSFGAANAVNQEFTLLYDHTNEGLFFTAYSNDAAGSTSTVTRSVWNFVVVTYNGSQLFVYLNGSSTPDISATKTLATNTTVPLNIGRSQAGSYFKGSIDDFRIYNRALSASEIQKLYNGYPHTGSGVYSLGSKLNISGSLLNYTGELRTGNAYPITLSGNLLNLGQFTSTGTVYLRGGTNQTMTGNTLFHTLNATSNGRTRSIFFDHSSRQNASGSLVLQGTTTNPLSLKSTRMGSGANLLLDGNAGTQTIEYLNVKDNDASGGQELVCYATAEGCTNSGNNTNWLFTDPANRRNQFFFFGF